MKILIMFTDAGHGHRMTGEALKTVIEANHPWQVELVNPYREFLADIEPFKRLTGYFGEELYTKFVLKQGYTKALWPVLAATAYTQTHLQYTKGVKRAVAFWQKSKPDLVISVMPLVNRCLCESLRIALPHVPFITLITDFCDVTPHAWFQNREQFYICGTEKAIHQAQQVAGKKENVFATSGMVISPKFYQPIDIDQREERVRLGLDPEQRTGLVMFGGTGSNRLHDLAKAVDYSNRPIQLIFLCGRNPHIADSLRQLPTRYPKHIVEFTEDVPYYMQLADFFIGKPGPAAISEALVMKLPVFLEINGSTMFHERYNGRWAVEQGVGRLFKNYSDLVFEIEEIFKGSDFQNIKRNISQIQNQAVFEIPQIIDSIYKFNQRQIDTGIWV